ncbi:2-oxo acid dehydrogenase subunit E2 [bacterium]|nr:2-oxo acid dehydrogenase subunit E2 [bacterium]
MNKDKFNTPWRLIANAIYSPAKDAKVFGTLDVDVTKADEYVSMQRKSGNKITMTSIITSAVARSLAFDAPEMNCFVRRGRVVPRDYIDVMVSVLIQGGQEMSAVKIESAHTKTVLEIAKELKEKAADARKGTEEASMKNKYILSKIPWPFRKWTYLLIRLLVYGLGIKWKALGLSEHSFGSIMVTNVGTLGLTTALPALMPVAKLPGVISMGKYEQRPAVVKGEIVIRTFLSGGAVFDHRIVDGAQIGQFVRGVVNRVQKPELLDQIESKI